MQMVHRAYNYKLFKEILVFWIEFQRFIFVSNSLVHLVILFDKKLERLNTLIITAIKTSSISKQKYNTHKIPK